MKFSEEYLFLVREKKIIFNVFLVFKFIFFLKTRISNFIELKKYRVISSFLILIFLLFFSWLFFRIDGVYDCNIDLGEVF